MVTTFIFQPSLLDCWACRDLKRFRQVLKGGGGIPITQNPSGPASHGKDGGVGPGSPSTSYGRSPGQTWGSVGNALSGLCPPSEVNRRDHLGRTVLHLLAASTEPASVDYLTAVLSHPNVNLNLQDHENGWTALHRALYHGNLQTALTLLKRSPPADVRVKDFEGLSPFDLYNSTVHGTNPPDADGQAGELFTWGANRNFTLGIGTSDDRILPDRVIFPNTQDEAARYARRIARDSKPGCSYDRVQVKDVGMSKFATIVLTAEKRGNVRACGIGNVGRIGRAAQTQAQFEPLRDFDEVASAISVGPDHTCILTASGDLLTFGHNRFQQLGYVLEQGQGIVSSSSKGGTGAASATFGGTSLAPSDLDVQISPRKVAGPLKKEFVLGVAAGKLHCAAFTSDALYTWRTNTGQLGYDRAATPIQVTPRKVSAITANMTIKSVAVTDFATACLLESGDVFLLHNDAAFFVRFPQLLFSSQASVYRPRQARPKPSIQKISAGPNNVFAAISDIGDLWQFAPEHPAEYSQSSGLSAAAKATIKPQLIWSVRKNKKIGAARDVGFGQGQDMILVTESGHVFVRSRKADVGSAIQIAAASGSSSTVTPFQAGASSAIQSSGKGKSGWKPVPFLQRVFRVATNESGGFAAIKSDSRIRSIPVRGRSLAYDLLDALPHLKTQQKGAQESMDIAGELLDAVAKDEPNRQKQSDREEGANSDSEESDNENLGTMYTSMARLIAEAARRWIDSTSEQQNTTEPASSAERLPLGCDMYVIASGRALPTHRSVISARLPALSALLSEPPAKGTGGAPSTVVIRRKEGNYTTMTLTSSSFGTALLFLHYLYCDKLPPIWTASVGIQVEKQYSSLKMSSSQIRAQLRQLAEAFQLNSLMSSLETSNAVLPSPRLSHDMTAFFVSNVDVTIPESKLHDTVLRLADRDVPCHSVFLRRSPFFATLLQPQWTTDRWHDSILKIDMSHVRWQVARLILLHLYTDGGEEIFSGSEDQRGQDQFIDFVVEVLALSNEMILDKLKLICSSVLRRRIQSTNIAAMMTNADLYDALPLKQASMGYAARTLETLLESGFLDDLDHRMIKDLTAYIRQKQDERLHRTEADAYIARLIVEHNDYFFDLDIPEPSLGIAAARVAKRPPRSGDLLLSPPLSAALHPRHSSSPFASPAFNATTSGLQNGESADKRKVVGGGSGGDGMMFSMDDDVEEEKLPAAVPSSDGAPFTPWKSRRSTSSKAEQIASPASHAEPSPLNLRSIMAAERSDSSAHRPAVAGFTNSVVGSQDVSQQRWTSVTALSKMSQKDRKRQQQQSAMQTTAPHTSDTQSNASLAGNSAASPWKPVESKPAWSTPASARAPMTDPHTPPILRSDAANPIPDDASQMGPMFSPTRVRPGAARRSLSKVGGQDVSVAGASAVAQTPPAVWATSSTSYAALGTSPNRRNDGFPAWGSNSASPQHGSPLLGPTMYASNAVGNRPVRPSLLSSQRSGQGSPAPAMLSAKGAEDRNPSDTTVRRQIPKSLMEIQAEEISRLEAMQASQQRAPKSFAQLQEEDRQDNERRLVEERERKEFEAWFAEEQKRLKREEQKQTKKAASSKTKKVGESSGSKQQNRQKGKGVEKEAVADSAAGSSGKKPTTPRKQTESKMQKSAQDGRRKEKGGAGPDVRKGQDGPGDSKSKTNGADDG